MARILSVLFLVIFVSPHLIAQKPGDKSAMEERRQIQRNFQQIEQDYNAEEGISKEDLGQMAVLNKKIELQEKSTTPRVENKPAAGRYLNYQAEDIALNADFEQNRGRLPHPVEGVITLGFGRYKIEGVGSDVFGDNPGVTYTTSVEAPVQAVFGGEVVSTSRVGDMSFVVIRHGKYFTAYSNLSSLNVSKGATISGGQTLGSVGADDETGSGKLDFILMIEERNVDPRSWLR